MDDSGGDAGRGLLERESQLGELTERLASVTGQHRGCVVLISGEAGIGKTGPSAASLRDRRKRSACQGRLRRAVHTPAARPFPRHRAGRRK